MIQEKNFLPFREKLAVSFKKTKSVSEINSIIYKHLLISNFFENIEEISNFFTQNDLEIRNDQPGRDFGDFQTPFVLTNQICKFLFDLGIKPCLLIEPTCGDGNFVLSALEYFPNLKRIVAIDIQHIHEKIFKKKILLSQLKNKKNSEINFIRGNIFKIDLKRHLNLKSKRKNDQIIAIGNPP